MLTLRSPIIWCLLVLSTNLFSAQNSIDLDLLLQPVQMTREGLNWFFTSVYNSPRYTAEILPESLANLSEFLTHGKQLSFGRDYTKATFSLFSQKVKGCEYMSAYEFTTFLTALPHLVDHHFAMALTRDQRKRDLQKLLYHEFLNKFDDFKADPNSFFDALSDQLLDVADPDAGQPVSIDALRSTVIRFLEVSLSKIYWDPNDLQLWSNIRDISNGLSTLQDSQIVVDSDDMNDLLWSLAHRLSYFISLMGTQLPNQFFEDVQSELRQPTCCLLLHDEQVPLIESKRHMIERIITEQFARKQAIGYGIITESIS